MSTNSSMKKTQVQDMTVLNINGDDLYLDDDGNVVHKERKNKKKLFNDATNNIKQQQEAALANMLAQQKQNS